MSPVFANVILPLPLEPTFSYAVPEAMRASVVPGVRVIVPFGAHKFYTGIVESVTDRAPEGFQVKDIASVPDDKPVIRYPQLKLWQWMADYYLCSVGDVMKAALPAGLKVESETVVEANPDMEAEEAAAVLTERELFVWQHLDANGKVSLSALGKATGIKGIAAVTNRMIEKGAVIISEKLIERFRPKKCTYVRVAFPRGDSVALGSAFEKVRRSERSQKALMSLIDLSGFMRPAPEPLREVTREALLERSGVPAETVRTLASKGVVEVYTREVSRFRYDGAPCQELPVLSDAQRQALDGVHRSFMDKRVCLLHGVTGSGKTEIYIHLIDYVLRRKMQVLYLVPEIALTTQLTRRLQRVFGHQVVIYHSRFSDNERVEIWQRLLHSNSPCVVIGARSAALLPFAKLGLVIVDEEHEPSYKQYDPAPRYNGRDVATVLASMHGAPTLLGSATPTVETYYKASTGKYGLVSLSERFAGAVLPKIEVVDMNLARKRMEITGAFARSTAALVSQAIGDGNQVILFQNRRGYAPVALCRQCGYIPKCEHCDVSLTYHRHTDRLHCHYCGATYPMPEVCPVCKEPSIEVVGYGTERIEDDVAQLFGKARLLRMDLDTTRNKEDYSRIIDAFSQRKADILVGTQMVTKGLDFEGVSTVVVLDADSLSAYPDFRSAERAFNMLEQVGGRAGRGKVAGTVVIQARNVENPVVAFAREHNYMAFYEHELAERMKYCYPPFSRVIYIYIKHRDARALDSVASAYAAELRRLFGNRVFGPQEPPVARVANLYIRKIMLKIEPQASMPRVREVLRDVYIRMHSLASMKGMLVHYDVDPQ